MNNKIRIHPKVGDQIKLFNKSRCTYTIYQVTQVEDTLYHIERTITLHSFIGNVDLVGKESFVISKDTLTEMRGTKYAGKRMAVVIIKNNPNKKEYKHTEYFLAKSAIRTEVTGKAKTIHATFMYMDKAALADSLYKECLNKYCTPHPEPTARNLKRFLNKLFLKYNLIFPIL